MTAALASQTWVGDTPPVETPHGGLLEVAVVNSRANGWGNPQFESVACMELEEGEFCGPREVGDEKLDWSPSWSSGPVQFSAYGMLNCGLMTFGWESEVSDSEPRAAEAWKLAESKAVEKAFVKRVLGTADTVELAAGAPQTPKIALSMLETYAGAHYNAVPIIHMNLALATLLFEDGNIVWDGDSIRTALGSKVVLGRGYDVTYSRLGTVNPAGQSWMYVTGAVVIDRIGALAQAPVADVAHNQAYVLNEQSYMATVDCLQAAVLAYDHGITP